MTILECKVCGHIEFNEAPAKCLVCRSPQTAFAENQAAVNQPENPQDLTDGDKKHLPVIQITACGLAEGCSDVHASIGSIEHMMTPEHFITYVDYYLNEKFISRIWLSPENCKPITTLHVAADSGKITVIEHCNLHGNWMSEATID